MRDVAMCEVHLRSALRPADLMRCMQSSCIRAKRLSQALAMSERPFASAAAACISNTTLGGSMWA